MRVDGVASNVKQYEVRKRQLAGPTCTFLGLVTTSQGLTLVHCSAQAQPFLTQNTP
jgi:hypothetical protein